MSHQDQGADLIKKPNIDGFLVGGAEENAGCF
jgi:triosephosphate isomerase